MKEKIVGWSKIYENNRITITSIMKLLKLKEGDGIIFLESPKGNIIVKKMKP